MQALANNLFLGGEYTVYNQNLPDVSVTKQEVTNLIDQLHPSFLYPGDMNAKSTLWGGKGTDNKLTILEQLMLVNNISPLDDNSPTSYQIQTNSDSVI